MTTCGTCRHGTPDGSDVACTLGWEAHDALWTSLPGRRWEPTTAGHPGVPLPLLTPGTPCMATGGRWAPRE